MTIFLSHISEEAAEAQALKTALEIALPSAHVFVSASDIRLGDAWLKEIDTALSKATAVLALCSENSIRRPWLNFECGTGWTRGLPIIPVCHKGLQPDRLPDPLRIFQGIELSSGDACRTLVTRLAEITKLKPAPEFSPAQFQRSLVVQRQERGAEIGVVTAHRQREWDDHRDTMLTLTHGLPSGLSGDWRFRELSDERPFLLDSLHAISGLIFTSPWRAGVSPECMSATIDWVNEGGRILFLGFELGDRHHDANLAQLTHAFGIHPSCDIVGPPEYGPGKPYGAPVRYEIADADNHPVTAGISTIELVNSQTVIVEPGGTEWLRVGKNSVYRPRRDSVRYRDGTLTTPGGSAFELVQSAGWLPVAVEAPSGLCGRGGAMMIGTWDLLSGRISGGANGIVVERLLNWLAGM